MCWSATSAWLLKQDLRVYALGFRVSRASGLVFRGFGVVGFGAFANVGNYSGFYINI